MVSMKCGRSIRVWTSEFFSGYLLNLFCAGDDGTLDDRNLFIIFSG